MAANAIDLCLSSTVAADLGIADSATVQRVVTAASRAISRHCGRSFEKATGLVEYPRSSGRALLQLARAPVVSIASVYEGGALVDSTEYECVGDNASAGLVFRLTGLWMSTALYGGRITDTIDGSEGRTDDSGVKVTYTAGWSTPGQILLAGSGTVDLPEDIQEAAIQTATAMYLGRGRDVGVAAESIGDWSVTYRDLSAASGVIPPTAKDLLAPYVFQKVS